MSTYTAYNSFTELSFRRCPVPLNTEMMTLRVAIEVALAVLAILVGFALPRLGDARFRQFERVAGRIARRPTLVLLMVGLAAPIARIAMLPWMPVPVPAIHDEFSFLLASDTFASGRLTNLTHPMWIHFETFHVDQKPTYMSMYPPAQGLILASGRVLFGHPWFGVCLSMGIMCGAVCWMLYGWLPPGWAMLGGFIVVTRLGISSTWMNSYYGGAAGAIGGALALGALPRLMRHPGPRSAALLATGLVILANSRPYEGTLIAVPVLIILIVWACGKAGPPVRTLFRRIIVPASVLLVLAATAMAYYNWRVFASPLTLPYQANRAAYAVAPVFLWQSPRPEPVYHHKVIRDFFLDTELVDFLKARTLVGFFDGLLRKLLYIIFLYWTPAALITMIMLRRVVHDRRVKPLLIIACVFSAGSLLNAFSAPHYFAPATALIYAVLLQAMRHFRNWKPGGEPVGLSLVRTIPAVCLLICVLLLSVVPYPPQPGLPRDRFQRMLEGMAGRQLVLVRYTADHDPNSTSNVEWVYNAADIDASRVVWARDMGEVQNRELIEYFKGRNVWLVQPDLNPIRLEAYSEGL
jgi:hypothetical protein